MSEENATEASQESVLDWYRRKEREHRERTRFQRPRLSSGSARYSVIHYGKPEAPDVPFVRKLPKGIPTRSECRRLRHEIGKKALRKRIREACQRAGISR